MIRHSPAEVYIKYLLSHPDNYSEDTIYEMIGEKRLDWVGSEYLSRLKKQLIPPIPFRPYDREHFSSQHFINKHRIYTLYFQDAATEEALAIVENAKLKEFIEAMLLAGASVDLIARSCPRILHAKATSEGIERFCHYFWNLDLLDFTETRAVLAKRGNSGDADYKSAFRSDSRKIAAELPFSPVSALLAQVRMGMTPVGVNFAELMDRVRLVAGIKAYQYTIMDDAPFSSQKARDFIQVAQASTELMERSARPEELLVEKFNSLQLATDGREIPHINQLSEGRHTTDLQVVETKAELVEVDEDA